MAVIIVRWCLYLSILEQSVMDGDFLKKEYYRKKSDKHTDKKILMFPLQVIRKKKIVLVTMITKKNAKLSCTVSIKKHVDSISWLLIAMRIS